MKYRTLALAALLTGCATPYQQQGFMGGLTEVQLDTNRFRVSSTGNAYTSANQVAEMAMLKASEIALKNGYRYFRIIDANGVQQTSTGTTPLVTQSNSSAVVTGNAYGATGTSRSNTVTVGGQSYSQTKVGIFILFQGLNEKPAEEDRRVVNAETVCASVAPRYRVTCPKLPG